MDENQIFEEMKNEFIGDSDGKEIWEKGKKKLSPLLKNWAQAKIMLLTGDETQKDIAKEVIAAVEASISDVIEALKAELSNYLMEKVSNFLRGIVTKHLLPLLLSRF